MNVIARLPLKESLQQSLRTSEGRTVKVGGKRFSVAGLKSFAMHGCKCARCGREGNKILAWIDKGGGMHVDLFNETHKKGLILMNRDHIIPKSKKGGNTEWNYQTMCVKCNCKKGNNETADDHKLSAFRNHWKALHVSLHDAYWKYIPQRFRTKWGTNLFVKFRERHLHKFTFFMAKVTHKA